MAAALHFVAGQLLFEGGQLAMSDDCCCSQSCPACTGDVPDQLLLQVSGVTGLMGGCATCEGYNTAFTLDYLGTDGDACVWWLTLPEAICDLLAIEARIGDGVVQVIFHQTGATVTFNVFTATPLDCASLGVNYSSGGTVGNDCDFSNISWSLTAL